MDTPIPVTPLEILLIDDEANIRRILSLQLETEGHDVAAVTEVMRAIPFETGKPNMVIANTVKGKGVSFMENDCTWHHRVPDDKQYQQALRELDHLLAEIES